jgi:hypothetical protein
VDILPGFVLHKEECDLNNFKTEIFFDLVYFGLSYALW